MTVRPGRPCRRHMPCGYTLIEVIVMVTLLGVIATAVMPAVLRSVMNDSLAHTVRLIREADRQAREQAIGSGATILVHDGALVTVMQDVVKQRIALPDACQITWKNAEQTTQAQIWIDRFGRSADVEVSIRVGSNEQTFTVLGISGAWQSGRQ